MKLGFHIPVSLDRDMILRLGDGLLGPDIYNWVEIKYPYGTAGCKQEEYVDAVKSLIAKYNPGLSMHIPNIFDLAFNNTYVRDEILRQTKRCIDFAGELGVSVMPVHAGTIGIMDIPLIKKPEYERLFDEVKRKKAIARELTIEALKDLGAYAGKYNITLALENVLHEEEIIYSSEDLLSILNEVNLKNVRGLVDAGHANRAGVNPESFIRDMGSYLCHVHLSDNDGSCDLHLPLGKGNIDFNGIMEQLQSIGYKGAVIAEIGSVDVRDFIKSSEILGSDYFRHS